jgi:hypothetical protein
MLTGMPPFLELFMKLVFAGNDFHRTKSGKTVLGRRVTAVLYGRNVCRYSGER